MPWVSVWVWAVAAEANVSDVATGVREQVEQARLGLQEGDRGWAVGAMDAAWEVAHTASHGATGDVRFRFQQAQWAVERARYALWNGRSDRAIRELAAADRALVGVEGEFDAAHTPGDPVGLDVVNAYGEPLGEITAVSAHSVEIRLGPHDILGFLDLGGLSVTVPRESVVFGKDTGWWGADPVVFASGVTRGELERLSYQLRDLDAQGTVVAARE